MVGVKGLWSDPGSVCRRQSAEDARVTGLEPVYSTARQSGRGCRGRPIQRRPPRLAAFSCREYPELTLETALAAKPAEHLTIRLAPLAG
jgi:hypothetical protein